MRCLRACSANNLPKANVEEEEVMEEIVAEADRTYGNYDPNVCYNCGQQGHWRAECPEHMRMRHITRLTEGGRGRGGPQRRSTPSRRRK
ncbi:hypothetical protein FVA96_24155 [Escherichia coli]|nr:hypothetical protein [Escherichia coli]